MKRIKFQYFFFLYLATNIYSLSLMAQSASVFQYAAMRVDTVEYDTRKHKIFHQGQEHFYFQYDDETEVAEVVLYFDNVPKPKSLRVLASGDYEIIDSLRLFENTARFKVRFRQLTNSQFLKFPIQITHQNGEKTIQNIHLLPIHITYVNIYPSGDELFIGEEKVFEVVTNNIENLIVDYRWTSTLPINYRFSKSGTQLFLHVIPNELGDQRLNIPISLKKGKISSQGKLEYISEPIKLSFFIKEGRLAFLQLDQQEITLMDNSTGPILVQLDNHRKLQLGKTYRIEDQEKPGGALIAEIFTKTRLNNDKIVCDMRTYAYHRKADGYLYIKDGDLASFVTNVDITPKTTIENIAIQREGKDWINTTVVYPGETINVRLTGQGLHKSKLSFQGIQRTQSDTLLRNENVSVYRIKIPIDIPTRTIEIYNASKATGKTLTVAEHQQGRAFDYISLDLAGEKFNVAEIEKPIYFSKTLSDLVISFDRNKIDEGEHLYGRQFLKIDVKVSTKTGSLVELYRFDELVICPGELSPRTEYYARTDCQETDVNLNNYLSKKTYDMDEWSRIEIEISQIKERYSNGQSIKKRIIIYLKREYNFDIDVTFPAGLLILKSGDGEFTNFGGISFAMIAQLSFYQEGKIAKYQPFKVGAGFIAIDAFNFSESSDNRDVGMVVIGSLYPVSSERKLTFPIYTGFGYLLKEQKTFFLIGPGIRVRI